MLQKCNTVLIVYRNGSTIYAKENCAAFPGRHFPLFCFSGPIQFGVSPQHFCLTLNLIRKSKLFRKSRRCQLLIQFSEFQCYETSFLVLKMFCVNDGSNISNLKWHLVYSFPSHLPKFLFNLYLLSTGLSTAVRGYWSFYLILFASTFTTRPCQALLRTSNI